MNGILLQLYECPCSNARSRPLVLFAMLGIAAVIAVWIRWRSREKGGTSMNAVWRFLVVAALAAAVVAVFALKQGGKQETDTPAPAVVAATVGTSGNSPAPPVDAGDQSTPLPRLLDVGAGTCIPCKMMMPVLAELKARYAGRLRVEYCDIRDDPNAVQKYKIMVIPTQILYDASGKELFRHEGFFAKQDIVAKWKELGVDLSNGAPQAPALERLKLAKVDDRPRDSVCYMCDGDTNPKTLVAVQTEKGSVRLCSPHCYFIMYSCLTEDKTGFEKRVAVTDWSTRQSVPITEAAFLCGQDETTGRPWIRAFADRNVAGQERAVSGGNVLALDPLRQQEMSHRCGFCDRACYPQDASEVIIEGGVHTWGCCSHCALGVAARSGKNIEVHEKDRLTKEAVIVKTLDGKVASLAPATAVAWFGQRQKPDGTWASAGCFHQGFFTSAANLKKWVEQNPYETGRLITIAQALADKMKLSPDQIQKACKIGECSPK